MTRFEKQRFSIRSFVHRGKSHQQRLFVRYYYNNKGTPIYSSDTAILNSRINVVMIINVLIRFYCQIGGGRITLYVALRCPLKEQNKNCVSVSWICKSKRVVYKRCFLNTAIGQKGRLILAENTLKVKENKTKCVHLFKGEILNF